MSEMTAKILYFPQPKQGIEEQSTSQTQIELPIKKDLSGERHVDRISVTQLQGMLGKLNEVFQESNKPGWDGGNAEPISDATFYNATQLLSVLPVSLPAPEIVPDNDGYIEFEWCKERRNFSLYITDTNLVLYAGFYGKNDRLSGRFVYEGIFPNRVETLAKDVYREKTQ